MSSHRSRRKNRANRHNKANRADLAGASPRETTPQSRHLKRSPAATAWRFGWAAFLAFCTMAGLVTFWPRLTISMVSDPEQKVWLYVVNNDSFFSVMDVTGDCAITSIGVDYQGGAGVIRNPEAFNPQHRPLIRPQDAHTFRCPSFVVEHPDPNISGSVEIHVTYKYAHLLRRSEHVCYQLESGSDNRRVWVRQACP
jgi:hypothetical protein